MKNWRSILGLEYIELTEDQEKKRKLSHLKKIAVALAFLFFLILLLQISLPPSKSEETRPYTETPADSHVGDKFLGVSALGASEYSQLKNTEKGKESEQNCADFIKDKRDLNAQEGVWRATNVVAILTFLATGMAAAGLYFLYKTMVATGATLRHANDALSQAKAATEFTRHALRETRKANKLSLQPYLAIKGFQLQWDLTISSIPTLTLRLEIINKGKSIATNISDISITKCELSLNKVTANRYDHFMMKDIPDVYDGPVNAALIPDSSVKFRKRFDLQPALGDFRFIKGGVDVDFSPLPDAEIDGVFKNIFKWQEFKEMIAFCDIEGTFSFYDQFTGKRTCEFSINRFRSKDGNATSDPFDPISARIIEVGLNRKAEKKKTKVVKLARSDGAQIRRITPATGCQNVRRHLQNNSEFFIVVTSEL